MRAAAEEGERDVRGALVCDGLFSAFDAERNGSVRRAESLILARLKELRRHHECRAAAGTVDLMFRESTATAAAPLRAAWATGLAATFWHGLIPDMPWWTRAHATAFNRDTVRAARMIAPTGRQAFHTEKWSMTPLVSSATEGGAFTRGQTLTPDRRRGRISQLRAPAAAGRRRGRHTRPPDVAICA